MQYYAFISSNMQLYAFNSTWQNRLMKPISFLENYVFYGKLNNIRLTDSLKPKFLRSKEANISGIKLKLS